jgi:hypothetical protein
MILGLETSQTRLNLQVTVWCAIKLKDSWSTGLTQLLLNHFCPAKTSLCKFFLIDKIQAVTKVHDCWHTFSKRKESPKSTLYQGRHVQMSYREGFIDLIVVDLWLLNACFGNGLGDHTGTSYIFSLSPLHSPPAVSWNPCYQDPHLSGLNWVPIPPQAPKPLQAHTSQPYIPTLHHTW